MKDLFLIHTKVEQVVKKAGAILLSYFQKPLLIKTKSDGSYVTEADHAAETFLIHGLLKIIPQAAILSEESGHLHEGLYRWVIDPLDGTNNFIAGLPYFCIGVALEYSGTQLLSVVYNPCTEEYFYALKDAGFFCNDRSLQVKDFITLQETVLGIEALGTFLKSNNEKIREGAVGIISSSKLVRIGGSALLTQAYVASGAFGGALIGKVSWWDVVPALLFMKEAGGVIHDDQGGVLKEGFKWCMVGSLDFCKTTYKLMNL